MKQMGEILILKIVPGRESSQREFYEGVKQILFLKNRDRGKEMILTTKWANNCCWSELSHLQKVGPRKKNLPQAKRFSFLPPSHN